MNERGSLEGNNRKDHDDPAKAKFFVIAAVRLGGAILVMMGLLGLNGALPLPDIASYALIVIGIVDVFVLPVFLSKRWSSRRE